MFSAIAEHYDLMNRVMTLGQDHRWRRQAAHVAQVGAGDLVLDVATGTGDLAFELAKRVAPSGEVIAVDVAPGMLDIARRKSKLRGVPVSFDTADALGLPFPDGKFAAVTCGFGLRNFEDRAGALSEMERVLRSSGWVVILELTPARNALARHYIDEVIPRMGQVLAGAREAYTYLPQSVKTFPTADELGQMMLGVGLVDVKYRLLNFGTVALHWGQKR